MGVHGLTGLLRRYAPSSLKTISASTLAHQSIAFDASCHLNKFVYGDEPHPRRHIYGFYSMARFCQLVGIKPIFVFDGSVRIKAKEYGHARRKRQRRKVLHSLSYERDRSQRLALWEDVADSYRDISDAAAARILDELGDTLDELEETTTSILNKRQQEELQHSSDQVIEQHVKEDVAAEERIEHKLALIARDLRTAMMTADDTERYTSTVRNLSKQEHQLMSCLIRERIHSAASVLRHVKDANVHMMGSLEKRSIRITQDMRDECIEFLRGIGFVCLTIENHEAEAMCARLTKEGRSNATVTEDMDTLVFGDAPILRYFFARTRPILQVDPLVARHEMGLTRDQFIDLCILCGTDFSATIHGIGPIRAYDMIRRYGSIERVLENLSSKYVPDVNFDYLLAREVFNSLPPIPTDDASYNPAPVDDNTIAKYTNHYDIDRQQVEIKLETMLFQQQQQHHSIIPEESNVFGPDPFGTAKD